MAGVRGLVAMTLAILAGAAPAVAHAGTRPVGSKPLRDRAAARLVHRSSFEPRPDNRADNHRVPYLAIIRAYYDGKMPWLNTVEHGRRYRAGDIWGSVGAWFAGRWHTAAAEGYIARVKQALRDKPWRGPGF